MPDEDLKLQMNTILDFAKKYNKCNYVIVTDDIRCNYWDYYIGKYVKLMTNNDFTRNNRGYSIEDMGNGTYYYINNTIYIAVPYISNGYTLLRTLTHEYGHCLQDMSGYNKATCNERLLEYHNIWFNENPKCSEITLLHPNIDNTGFRFSYTRNGKYNISKYAIDLSKKIKCCDECFMNNLFKGEFNDFYNKIIESKGRYNDKKLLQEIFFDMQKKTTDKDKYLLLFYNFLLGK